MCTSLEKVIELSRTIAAAGGRAMLVGGCVRDELMGVEPKDRDLEVYGIEPERLKELLTEFAESVGGEADRNVRGPFDADRNVSGPFDADRNVSGPFDAGRNVSGPFDAGRNVRGPFDAGRNVSGPFEADRNVRGPAVRIVGEAFAVYKLGDDLDVSIPRRERKTGRGHRAFVVEGDPDMSFEEACSRRDLTVNAILKDPLTGEIVDPFNGRDDIQKKVLRHVSDETFAEDSLRVLRAAQFAARLEFEIAEETAAICKAIDVTDLPKERIWGEVEKLLLQARRPSIGIKWLYELNVIDQIFPELAALVDVPQEPDWHPEGDVDIHTMMVVDEARKLIDELDYPRQVAVMLGALCHDLGKPPTTEFVDGRIRSRGHDEAGVEPTIALLDTLGIHTIHGFDVRQQVIELVRYHLKPGEFYKAEQKNPVGDGAFRRLARKVEPDLLYRVAKADSLGRNPEWLPRIKWFDSAAQEWFIERVRSLQIEKKAPEPILKGRHLIELGMEPSPRFSKIISAVYELQLDGKVTDLSSAIEAAQGMLGEVQSGE